MHLTSILYKSFINELRESWRAQLINFLIFVLILGSFRIAPITDLNAGEMASYFLSFTLWFCSLFMFGLNHGGLIRFRAEHLPFIYLSPLSERKLFAFAFFHKNKNLLRLLFFLSLTAFFYFPQTSSLGYLQTTLLICCLLLNLFVAASLTILFNIYVKKGNLLILLIAEAGFCFSTLSLILKYFLQFTDLEAILSYFPVLNWTKSIFYALAPGLSLPRTRFPVAGSIFNDYPRAFGVDRLRAHLPLPFTRRYQK